MCDGMCDGVDVGLSGGKGNLRGFILYSVFVPFLFHSSQYDKIN